MYLYENKAAAEPSFTAAASSQQVPAKPLAQSKPVAADVPAITEKTAVQPEKPVVAVKPVAPEKPVVLEKVMVLEKKARAESVAGKLEVVTLNNAASADIVALNKQFSSSMVKALRNTCLQEVNGLPTTRKAAPQTTDAAYVLVVKPDANQDAPAHAKLTMALHQLSSQYPSPVAENGVWKAAVTMKVDAAANKEKIREIAVGMVKLMDDDKLFETSCLNQELVRQ